MTKIAVVRVGGKQYLVKENDSLVVNHLKIKEGEKINLETLAVFDEKGKELIIKKDKIKNPVEARMIESGKGEKIRVARFKAKVRYRKVRGFRPLYSKIQILKI